MAVENQPTVLGDGFVEHAIDAVVVDIAIDQRSGAQKLQIRDPAVDARNNTTRGMEDFLELPFAPHRSEAVGIGKILDSDRWVERQQIATVVLDLGGQCCRIEIGGSLVREGVAGDFVALAVKLHNLIATYSGPMARPF